VQGKCNDETNLSLKLTELGSMETSEKAYKFN